MLSSIHCPDESTQWRRGRSRREARPVQFAATARQSAQLHFDSYPYQIGMILGAEFLLQERGDVGYGLVGNTERIGDLNDLVAAAQQTQDFQFACGHLRSRVGLD